MTSHPSSSKQHHDLSPGGGGSSAAPIAEKEQQSNVATSLTKSILDFPSQLFHECFRKSFVLELDRLCGLAWEISRMEDEEEDTDVDQKYHPQDKTKVLFETRIEALRLRWYKFDDLYSEHTKCEDLTVFPELNLRVANVTKAYELEHEAEEWLFEEVGGLVDTVWKETKEMMDGKKANRSDEGGDDFGKRESVKLVLAKAARGLHATKTMLKAHLAKESAQVLPLLKRYFSEDEAGEDDVVVFRKISRGESDWDIRVGVWRDDDDDARGRARVFGEFGDVFENPTSENVRGSSGVEIEIEEMDRRGSERGRERKNEKESRKGTDFIAVV